MKVPGNRSYKLELHFVGTEEVSIKKSLVTKNLLLFSDAYTYKTYIS